MNKAERLVFKGRFGLVLADLGGCSFVSVAMPSRRNKRLTPDRDACRLTNLR